MKPVAWINKDWMLAFVGQREMAEDTEREGGCKAVDRGRRYALAKFAALLGALAFILLLTSVTSPPLVHATFPGANGKIAFTTVQNGTQEVYLMNPDGTGQTNCTNNPAYDFNPAWSADGTKIAFASNRDGNINLDGFQEIYVMNADCTGVVRLTNNSVNDNAPAWSPDGTKIAFVSYRDGNGEIYVMNANGSGQTNCTNNSAEDTEPDWSPDGTKIAFVSNRDGTQEVYVMNADCTGTPTNLTNNSAADTTPSWSSDGTKIAFASNRDGNGEIYIMNANGSGQTNCTNNSAHDDGVVWAPDGTKIAFRSNRDGDSDIYVMSADCTGTPTRLTTSPGDDIGPDWQPLPIPVATDIKPQSCPNPLNVKAKGVLPVAILGTSGFDVTKVDPASVRLEGVPPLRSALEDVATPFVPFTGKVDCSDCTTAGPDGFLDLTLKFDTQAVVAALGTVSDRECLVLELTGNLLSEFGGTPIVGEDVVVILKK